jgi:peptidoglycan/xylan/chitin deacetylase (PgdA/CDA1 family)
MLRAIISLFSGIGKNGRLLILTYHRVREQRDPIFAGDPDKEQFAAQMRMLRKYFNVLTLRQAVAEMREGRLPERAICVTFDDGYSDNPEVAAPILEEQGIAATFFIATGYLNGGIMWNDRIIETLRQLGPGEYDFGELGQVCGVTSQRPSNAVVETLRKLKYLPCDERDRIAKEIFDRFKIKRDENIMMTDAMVQSLHNRGMEIGAHTVSHPILARLDAAAAAKEVEKGKTYLEDLVQADVTSFAYPNGKSGKDLTVRDVEIVRDAGFDVAVTTDWGVVTKSSNRWALPRISLTGTHDLKVLAQLCRDYRSTPQATIG